jgi:2OG-Fe(II) oxygenase superfamily
MSHRIGLIEARPPGNEQVPAAFVGRVHHRTALHQGPPVHRLILDVHADLLQHISANVAFLLLYGLSRLAQVLMRVFALGPGQREDFFDDKIDRYISCLRIRNYPPPAVPPQPGQLRAGAHSDYGSLTILATENRPDGLQACNAAGAWVDVPAIPGCFIVNIGDLMARWTNDAWVSTLHRVVNPPDDAQEQSRESPSCSFTTRITTRQSPAYPPASLPGRSRNTSRPHQEHISGGCSASRRTTWLDSAARP